MGFDYGDKKTNGQYESYPTNTSGEYVAPIRNTYVHRKCGVATTVSNGIAETYAKNPKYYGQTFCVGCKDHFPVDQFEWNDGVTVGEIGPSAEERKMKHLLAQKQYYQNELLRVNQRLEEIDIQIKDLEPK